MKFPLWSVCLTCIPFIFSTVSLTQSVPATDRSNSVFAGIPLVFEPNVGQAEPGVQFLANGRTYAVLVERARMRLRLLKGAVGIMKLGGAQGGANGASKAEFSEVSLALVRAGDRLKGEGKDLLPGKSNYYSGRDRSQWREDVPQYAKVAYRSVYEATDLVYYGRDGELEYDFVLHPGAKANAVRFRVQGAEKIATTQDGDLEIAIKGGQMELKAPLVYQEDGGGRRRAVAARYIIHGRDEVGFAIGDYDRRQDLVVDPVVSYSSLLGVNGYTTVQGVTADKAGNAYVVGTTSATNYPVVKAVQGTLTGGANVFVTKLGPNGVIVFSTYLGGGNDNGEAIAADGQGNAYVAGIGDQNFPTTPGAYQTTCTGLCNPLFVAKLGASGQLVYSTFAGASASNAQAIAVNSAGDAYIAGSISSSDLPTTAGAFQPEIEGSGTNGFVEELNASGSAVLYATYFGSAIEPGNYAQTGIGGVAVDSAGNLYIAGNTSRVPLKNPLQSGVIGGPNAFVAKLTPDGSSLVFSTILGGQSAVGGQTAGDYAYGVAVDGAGNVHVAGTTTSCEFPLTLNSLNTECPYLQTGSSAFAVVLDPTGSQLLMSTLLPQATGNGVATDSAGNTYVAGSTSASNFPLTKAVETQNGTPAFPAAYVTEFDPTGKLVFSTFLGATGQGVTAQATTAAGIGVDGKGNIYVAGQSVGDFPLVTPIPSTPANSGYGGVFMAKIGAGTTPEISLSPRQMGVLALRNVGGGTLSIQSITPSSGLAMGGDCGSDLAAGAGCQLILQSKGSKPAGGTVTIASNASGSPQKFTLAAGSSSLPGVTITPGQLVFNNGLLGTTSSPQAVRVENLSLGPLAINGIVLSPAGIFAQTNDCPALLNAGQSCTIAVTYTASETQTEGAQLNITHDPQQTSDVVYLGGEGSAATLVPSTTRLPFGSQKAGTTSLSRVVNLINTSPYPASVKSISATAPFTETNTCTVPVAPQASCRIAVSYTPKAAQSNSGILTFTGYGPGGSQTVNLSGNGWTTSALGVSPGALTLETVEGLVAASGSVTASNGTSQALPLGKISVTTPFTQTNNCGTSLGAGASCTVTVQFAATQPATIHGHVTIPFTGTGSPLTVALTGIGDSALSFEPPAGFTQQVVGTTTTQFAGLGNGTPHPTITVSSISLQGADFSIVSNTCPTTFPPFTGCDGITLGFTPTQTGLRTATLTVMADDSSQAHVLTLQGTGVSSGKASLSVNSVDFGTETVETVSKPVVVTVTNTGTGLLGIAKVSTNTGMFKEGTTCGNMLAAGASCTVSVRFAPTLQGILAGSLTIADDGMGGPHVVRLVGVGQ
jgi:hypothetical protein